MLFVNTAMCVEDCRSVQMGAFNPSNIITQNGKKEKNQKKF